MTHAALSVTTEQAAKKHLWPSFPAFRPIVSIKYSIICTLYSNGKDISLHISVVAQINFSITI